jgi:cyanate permease
MKYVIVLIAIASFISIFYGFSIQEEELLLANKFIGFGTVGLFLVAMPLFLIKESKGKKMKDYMLNEENIRKMRRKEREKSENQ